MFAGSITTYDGATFSTLAADVTGYKSLAVTATAAAGKAQYYGDGASIGAGVNNLTMAVGSSNWSVAGLAGTPVMSPIQALVVYPDALTATEVQATHDYFAARFTPRKKWSGNGLNIPSLSGSNYKPLFLDNLQSSRVTLANETSGYLSNTPYRIAAGTWSLGEDAQGRYIQCEANNSALWRDNTDAYGSFRVSFSKQNDSSYVDIMPVATANTTIADTAQNGYLFRLWTDEGVYLGPITAGAVGAWITASPASYLELGTRYDFHVTRTATGVWTTYIKGGRFANWTLLSTSGGSGSNPGTENTHTTSQYSLLFCDQAGDKIYLDEHYDGVWVP
jgi:hypothetical protein